MDMESQKYCLHFPLRWKYAMNAVYLRIHHPKCIQVHAFLTFLPLGIDARDDLLRTIHRIIDNGHAARLAGFYHRWFRYSPCEWRDYLAELNEQGQAYAQFVASTAECCGEGGIKARDYVRMGF